jgi:hypothetical protein
MVNGGSADREHGRAAGDAASPETSRNGAPFRRYSLIVAASIVSRW